ncbi:MAG: GH3 auxin-responsive promoter family protein [Candidatus Omnitrophica bacterium]|nr:GH3 auxin-responsive promoter family protein [Candidatus Omnitrophota bacterium]
MSHVRDIDMMKNEIVKFAVKFLAPKAKAFEDATKDPLEAQRKILLEYLARNRKTEYGLKYGFSDIRSIEGYRKAVPLSDCESMRPYLERIAKGEENILMVDKPVFFGATSGTTNAPKYIPSTVYSNAKKEELTDIWGYYIARDHPDIFKGKILAIMSSEVEGYTASGVPYGAESGHGYKGLNPLIRSMYVLPYEVLEIPDFDARYYCILRISIAENVTTIATLNPNTIILLCRKIGQWQDRIIEDIKNGKLSTDISVPDDIRKKIEKHLKPDPERASELRDILDKKKELLPKYFWPDLDVIECWKGGTMKVYLKELPSYFGKVSVRDIGYVATEARSSIPVSDEGAGGVLAIQTNFYEFIPKEDMGRKDKRLLLCDELEKGRDYFIVVTTAGGLYRYNIDDIIHVNAFFNKTPVIEFVQKGRGAASLAGEKLYESHVDEALNRVLNRTKLPVEFFCAVAIGGDASHYAFLVEFSGTGLSRDVKRDFLKSMEEELRRQDREYDYVRNAQLLDPPVLRVVRKGEFEKYRTRRLQEGAHDSQFKVPELTADPAFQDNFSMEEEIVL